MGGVLSCIGPASVGERDKLKSRGAVCSTSKRFLLGMRYWKHLGQHISPVDEAALCSLKEQNTAREDIHSLYGFNSTIQSLLAYILCCYIGQEFSRGEGCGDKRCF